MRIISTRILTFLTLFFTGLYSYSAPGNPPPPQQLAPPPPPGFPIDSELLFLFFTAVIYGFYRVYEFNRSEDKSV